MPHAIRFGRAAAESKLSRTTNLPASSAFTIMAWVRARGIGSGFTSNTPTIFALSNSSTGNGYQVDWEDASYTLGIVNINVSRSTGTTTPVDTWHHLAMTVNGTSGTNGLLYKDGALDASITASSVAVNTLYIASDPFSEWSDCNVAALKIWNRALSADEVVDEMLYAIPVNPAALNSAYPIAAPWDFANYDVAIPRGTIRRWTDVSNIVGNDWTETGTIDMDLGPPVQFAPSLYRRTTRRFVAAAVAPPSRRRIHLVT